MEKERSIGRDAEVSDNEKRNIAKLQTDYVLQQEESQISVARRKKLLYRRLTVFFILVADRYVFNGFNTHFTKLNIG